MGTQTEVMIVTVPIGLLLDEIWFSEGRLGLGLAASRADPPEAYGIVACEIDCKNDCLRLEIGLKSDDRTG